MRPIDADTLSALLFKRMGEYETIANDLPKNSYESCVYYGKVTELYETQLAIDRIIPTLDYAPVRHASWIRQDDTYTRFQCGECKSKNFDRSWVFCPLCGAKMDGGWKHDEA